MFHKKTYQSELWKCCYFQFLRKPEIRNNILPYKIETNVTFSCSSLFHVVLDQSKAWKRFPAFSASCILGFGSVPSHVYVCYDRNPGCWFHKDKEKMFFMENAFQRMLCWNRAHMNDLWQELYFFLFPYHFTVRLVGWVWVGVFILIFVTVRKRNENIQLRCQGFWGLSELRRERPFLCGEKPCMGRRWKIFCKFWGLVLRIEILSSNPQKLVFYSFSLRIF